MNQVTPPQNDDINLGASAPPFLFETERLLLRPYAPDDFGAVHTYASDEENARFMLFDPNTEEGTHEFICYAMDTAAQTPITKYECVAVLKTTGELIGGCGIHAEDVFENGVAEVGWMLNRRFWRQGYGTEIGAFLLRFGFTELGCRRIIARCDAENTASYGVMQKIGMRREGCFIEGRRSNCLLNYAMRDELAYAILADEWHTQREVEYYNTMPVVFTEFINLPELTDGVVELVCIKKDPGDPIRKYVPAYLFDIRLTDGGARVGDIGLRIGYTDGLYYGGQIGYNVGEAYRGNGYAVRACKLLAPVIKAHGMREVLITNNHTNTASRRVCEKLGARLLRVARLPEWCDLYKEGQRFSNIFAWEAE